MITATAFAKVNLSLHVTGKRQDGYHNLQSLVTFADFGDTISLTPAPEPRLTLDGPFAKGISSTDNLALQALTALCTKLSIPPNFHIHLTKNIPHGAGLGGGSSDAASIIHMILKDQKRDLPDPILNSLLLELGSDVPVCFLNMPSWMEGRGEINTSCTHMPALFATLIWPRILCPTKDLFAQIQEPYTPAITCPLIGSIDALKHLKNDFENPACRLFPVLNDVRSALLETKSVMLVRMSGSGSAWFGLYPTLLEASQAEIEIKNRHPQWFTRSICLKGSHSL